jgi:hypothetical protein
VWQRLNYRTHDLLQRTAAEIRARNVAAVAAEQPAQPAAGAQPLLPRRYEGDLLQDDAFDTIIQWLYWRMPFVKGGGVAAGGGGAAGVAGGRQGGAGSSTAA